MCSRPRQLHFLTHSLSSVLVHATQSRSSACLAVPLSLSLFSYISLSFCQFGSFGVFLWSRLPFVCVPHIYDSANVCSQSVEYLMPSSPKRWRRQFLKCLCCPCYSPPLSLFGHAVGSSSSSIHLKIWHQMSASASASAIAIAIVVVVCRLHAHLRSILTSFSLLQLFVLLLWVY